MKPQKQLFRHKPDEGIYGDCCRTAIAILLDMDAKDVPHFMHGAADNSDATLQSAEIEKWLNARGLTRISFPVLGELSLEEVFEIVCITISQPNIPYSLVGQSKRKVNHEVVCLGREIVCDPSLEDSGLIGPCNDGYWWVTFIGVKEPAEIDRLRAELAAEREKSARFQGTLHYILAQVKANHPGVLQVVRANAEMALSDFDAKIAIRALGEKE